MSDFSPLNPIFKPWRSFAERYFDLYEEASSPFYYNERTNVGLLASAAWASGFCAFQELGLPRKRCKRIGRVDLLIESKKHDYVLEAKQVWNVKEADGKMAEALQQVQSIRVNAIDKSCVRCGVLFIVHGFRLDSQEESVNSVKELIKKIDQQFPTNKNSCITHHYYPRDLENARGSGRFENITYPGVSVVIKA